MSAFEVAPQYNYLILPTVGRVMRGRVLLGESFRKYAEKGLLVEIPQPTEGEATTALETPKSKKILEADEPRPFLEQPAPSLAPVLTETATALHTKHANRPKAKK